MVCQCWEHRESVGYPLLPVPFFGLKPIHGFAFHSSGFMLGLWRPGLAGGRGAQPHSSLHPAAGLCPPPVPSSAAKQNQLWKGWKGPGCVHHHRFGVKCLHAGLGLKGSAPQGVFPFPSIGKRPVLCSRQHLRP